MATGGRIDAMPSLAVRPIWPSRCVSGSPASVIEAAREGKKDGAVAAGTTATPCRRTHSPTLGSVMEGNMGREADTSTPPLRTHPPVVGRAGVTGAVVDSVLSRTSTPPLRSHGMAYCTLTH